MFSLTLIYTSPVSNKNKNKNYIMLTLIFASNLILEYRSIKKFDTEEFLNSFIDFFLGTHHTQMTE